MATDKRNLELVLSLKDQMTKDMGKVISAVGQLDSNSKNAKVSFNEMTAAVALGNAIYSAAESAIMGAVRSVKGFAKESIEASLELERQTAILPVLAKGYGISMKAIKKNIDAVRAENKSVTEATSVTMDMIRANIDLTDSEKLLTAARDLGAAAGQSSSKAMDAILKSIIKANPSYLEQIDLVISEREVYQKLADTLGVTTGELTMAQKQQALYNEILSVADKNAGAYNASMDTTGKLLNSIKDGFIDVKIVVGELLSGAFYPMVEAAYNALKAFRAWAFDGMELNDTLKALADRISNFVLGAFTGLIEAAKGILGALRDIVDFVTGMEAFEHLKNAVILLKESIVDRLIPAVVDLIDRVQKASGQFGGLAEQLVATVIVAFELAVDMAVLLTDTLASLIDFVAENQFAFYLLEGAVVLLIGKLIVLKALILVNGIITALKSLSVFLGLATTNTGLLAGALAALPMTLTITVALVGFSLVMSQIQALKREIGQAAQSEIDLQNMNQAAIKKAMEMREAGDTEGAQRILDTVQRSLNTGVEARANGGPVTAGKPYIVGERGPEMIIPRSSGTVLPNGAGGVTVNVFGDVSGRDLVERVQQAIMGQLSNNVQLAL